MNDLHKTKDRIQLPLLQQVLSEYPVVVLHGARQTGKTTLTQFAAIGQHRSYLTLDDFDVLERAQQDPASLFLGREQITLDEVQRQPSLLLAIKRAVDQQRQTGRFLLTGSANLLLMQKVADSLAGRAVYFHLPPLIWAEIEERPFGACLDAVLEKPSVERLLEAIPPFSKVPARSLEEAILAGGYPVPALADASGFRTRWFDGYVQTYLERDLRDLSATGNLIDFRRLMHLCAVNNSRSLNMASLANDAGVSAATVGRYLNLLEMSFQIVRLPAYAVNRGKRLIKAPKLLWSDTGLATHLAGIADAVTLVSGREWGFWLENWVGVHLLAYAELRTPKVSVSHWRTSNGREVDFVLEVGKKLVPVEVKSTSRPMGKELKGLNAFLDTYEEAPFGVMACLCDQPTVLSSRILALPIAQMLLT